MKYVLFIVGVVLGVIVSPMITDSEFIQWVIQAGMGLFGYNFAAVLNCNRMWPQNVLKFHGENSPIMRSKSLSELKAFMRQLERCGLLVDIVPKQTVVVNRAKWNSLADSEKLCFSKISAQFFRVSFKVESVIIKSIDERHLASYSPEEGFLDKTVS
jgi:hypothetical protein